MNNRLYYLCLIPFLLSACGEFAYKRGAGAADLDKAQQACQASNSSPAAVEQCLQDNGWVVQKLDDLDPVAVLTPNTDNRAAEVGSPTTAEAQNTAAETPSAPKKPVNPLDVYNISSWWKMGGNEAKLNAALDECVAKLGEAHRPDSKSQKATRGLLLCMRESGWHGLQAK